MDKRSPFLTVCDLGENQAWTYIRAPSARAILDKYPQMAVLEQAPDWLDEATRRRIPEHDLEEEGEFSGLMLRHEVEPFYFPSRGARRHPASSRPWWYNSAQLQ